MDDGLAAEAGLEADEGLETDFVTLRAALAAAARRADLPFAGFLSVTRAFPGDRVRFTELLFIKPTIAPKTAGAGKFLNLDIL